MNNNEDKSKVNETPEKSPVSEDKISLKGSTFGIKNTERNIKPTTVVHTSGSNEIYIPDGETQKNEISAEPQRFIKTNATPFISVSAEKAPETDGKDIDKYSDRINVKAPSRKTHTGNTTKINIYTNTHSAQAENARMIKTPEIEPELYTDETTAEKEATKTREVAFDDNGMAELENIYSDAPTRHIDDNKGSLLREIADTAQEGVRRNPDQLMMEGFDSVGKKDKAQLAREQEEAEKLQDELHKTRQKRINSFKFWNKQNDTAGEDIDTTDEKFSQSPEKSHLPAFLRKFSEKFSGLDTAFTPVDCEEYTDYNTRRDVFTSLLSTRKNILLRIFAVAAIGIILLITDIAAAASASADINGFFSLFGGSYIVYTSVNLALLIGCAVIMARDLKTGLFSLIKLHPKADTSVLFLLLSAILQTVCAYFTQLKLEENFHFIAPVAVILCVPYLLAKLFYYDNMRQCFKAVATKSEKSYLRRVSDEKLVADILRDRETAEQNVVYAGKTRFIDNFLSRGENGAFAGMPSSRSVLITIVLSFAAGLIIALSEQNTVYGVTAFSICLAFSFPVSCLIATGYAISAENKKLSLKSSFVQDYKDARDFSAVDNIVINDSDIFTADITNCLTAKSVSDRQAKFCAAVLTSKFGGPLNAALMEEMADLAEKFPSAENLVYEEKLGLSAWVSGCKVLLGTHALLENHNVQLPDEKTVSAFLAEGETPVYLALEGKFAAVLGVKYSCKPETADNLRELVKNGTSILLFTYDSNLNESFSEKLLGMPECSIRIINSSVREKISRSMQSITNSEEAGIVFTDSFESLCRCACAAVKLDRTKRTSKLVCEAGAYVSLLLGAILGFAGEFGGKTTYLPILVQLIWIAICFIAPHMFASKPGSVKKPVSAINIENPLKNGFGKKKTKEKEPEQTTEDNSLNTEEAPVEKSAAVNEPKPEITEQKTIPEDVPGVVSQETYDVLDAMAGNKAETQNTVNADNEQAEDINESADTAEDASPTQITKAVGKAKNILKGIVSGFAVVEQIPDDEDYTEEKEEENTNSSFKLPFTATIPVRKHRSKLADEESEIITQAKEAARMRATFTPPEMPDAPHFNLNVREEPEEKASFVPPKTSSNEYFSDEMFSRFEDDNIFASLHDNDGREEKHYYF